ncbi:DUF6476 family protein [Parvibaculum lavamentivorans]|uniref:DUF6476 family protein n=1 Tax=Parvibaculum lavamentivorans TaxID=256618 RepID=UPI0002DFCF7E|nr:DUF6476 family protein [Parvibaculum lavamentivorans]
MAEDTTSQREAPQSVAAGGPDLRKLKRAMAIMSAVLVLSFMVVIAAFVWRLSGSGSREAALPSGDQFGVSRIAVAPGETVRSVTLDEERIAVHVGSDGAEAIIIINVKTGEELGRILLTPMSGFAARE